MKVVVHDRSQKNIYTQIAKEECESRVSYIPGDNTPMKIRSRIEAISLKAYRVLGCRDAGRLDIRCDEFGNPHFLEINPLAGLHPTHSDLCIIANQIGMNYEELIEAILLSAIERYSLGRQPEKVLIYEGKQRDWYHSQRTSPSRASIF